MPAFLRHAGRHGSLRGAFFAGLAAFLSFPGAAAGEGLICPNPMISVVAEDPDLSAQVCAIVDSVRPNLAQCGLNQTAPLTIEVADEPLFIHGDAPCLGLFDCAGSRIMVSHPDQLGDILGPDHPFAEIPAADLFASLIAHELSHAFLDQNLGGAELPGAAHEYLAYAMQFGVLPPDVRQRLLDARPINRPIETVELNDTLALGAPSVFALKAWRHFSTPGNGCDFVGKLIRGEVSLALDPI